MSTPFGIVGACEYRSVEPGRSTLWASVKVEPRGKALEAERAPLAVALVLDVSGSMHGEAIEHVLRSCEVVADLLGERDRLAIVTFSTDAGVRCGLTPTDAAGRARVKASLQGVAAGGHTNLHGGIEVAAGVLMTAPAGLRRAMVVLSDGQPNLGLSSAAELAAYVKSLGLAVSTLGFGLHHDDDVLDAIAIAGSGRYAYISDPALARVDLARAALAQAGIVADHLELALALAPGVELVQLLPASALRIGAAGVTTSIGDVFVDEGRALALELALDLGPGASGTLVELAVAGRAPDGSAHRATARLAVDVRSGARVVDPDGLRDVVLVQADHARTLARAQADRGAMPAAAQILRAMIARVEGLPGFVRNDGTPLAELREQLEDEAANYERRSTDMERAHQRKGSRMYKMQAASYAQAPHQRPPVRAVLVGIGGPVAGQRFELYADNVIGRSATNQIHVPDASLSRRHARVVFAGSGFVLEDLGSTNGTLIAGGPVRSSKLADGAVFQLGSAQFRFELVK